MLVVEFCFLRKKESTDEGNKSKALFPYQLAMPPEGTYYQLTHISVRLGVFLFVYLDFFNTSLTDSYRWC